MLPDGFVMGISDVGDARHDEVQPGMTPEPNGSPVSDVEDDSNSRHCIVLTDNEQNIADEAELILSMNPSIFQQGGQVVRVFITPSSENGFENLRVAPATPAYIRTMLSGGIKFIQKIDKERQTVGPPNYLAQSIIDRKDWPNIRLLNGIVLAPTIRRDGSLLSKPGYDQRSGLIHNPSRGLESIDFEAPIATGEQNARILLGLPAEFDWLRPCHAVAWLSLVLTMVSRHWIGGTTPSYNRKSWMAV